LQGETADRSTPDDKSVWLGPNLVPRLRRSDRTRKLPQSLRTGLTFGGRPSGPHIRAEFAVSFHPWLDRGKSGAPSKIIARRVRGTADPSASLLMTNQNWGVECCVSHSSPKQGLNGAPNVRCRCRSRVIALPTRARQSAPRDDKGESSASNVTVNSC